MSEGPGPAFGCFFALVITVALVFAGVVIWAIVRLVNHVTVTP